MCLNNKARKVLIFLKPGKGHHELPMLFQSSPRSISTLEIDITCPLEIFLSADDFSNSFLENYGYIPLQLF
jgi:hypothetical protein